MKKYIFTLLLCVAGGFSLLAAQGSSIEVLDKTAAAFQNAGGIKAGFTIKTFAKGRPAGDTRGTIQLKGNKFVLQTAEMITWFDGKTQWSYLSGSEEVNISNPTEQELQSMNPYTLLYMYKKGFSHKLGSVKSFRGKAVYEVKLSASSKKQSLSSLVIYVARDSYQPLYILAQQRDGSRSEIVITDYQPGQRYADSFFVFNRKQHPNVELIDLR